MSLFDFLFPEQAQASSEARIRELESEVAQLTIMIEALLEKLSDDGLA